jgi:hypothetical protein
MRKVGVLAIVLVGFVFVLDAVGRLTFPVQVLATRGLSTGTWVPALLWALVPVLASGAIGAYLLVSRERLAGMLFGEIEVSPAVAAADLVRAGFLLTGVYLMVQSAPSLISEAGALAVQISETGQYPGAGIVVLSSGDLRVLVFRALPGILATLASFGLGWFLAARSRQLATRVTGAVSTSATDPVSLRACLSCGAVYDPSDYEGGLCEPKCATCKQPLDVQHA